MNEECTWADVLRWHVKACAVLVVVAAVLSLVVDPIWWNATMLLFGSGAASALIGATKWGNPFEVTRYFPMAVPSRGFVWVDDAEDAVGFYRCLISGDIRLLGFTAPSIGDIRAELAGKDLMCFCPLDQPCHADVLLDIANGGAA